ncbi:MAG: PhoPQ-activated protein PqaA family protein [Massilibacteroides sp.]|nr:PhoPQ-activated protein PqaA family protein [Massilibacteroides sp.]MDD3061477.1 PhoPQ-activated protein PqaA family protein [Massilibacteroides sp.]MDD4114542.1 PhoPQ-activated protein PqaA family protein [Massilibacteroides sp.]MDD4659233.1 PhoPQ-activated protein PqaA family protein [Massilibacteroides sp.]
MKKLFIILSVLLSCGIFIHAQTITPATALVAYLHNDDKTYAWEVCDTYEIDQVTVYSLLFVSQKWQDILWKHELLVYVPQKVTQDGALLFISGGAINEKWPKMISKDDSTSCFLSNIAKQNKALVCMLKQVPNQPLYGGLKEDALISYTLNEFRKSKDYSWPLLFPMVKSARSAMNVVQDFANTQLKQSIRRFVISGASKRGWTTWLTGASEDPRVIAIAPMVIDMLNMPVSLDYQKQLYGGYSKEINDYVNLDIPQAVHSDFGKAIIQMIDPYSYREKLTMPKLIFMATNDPYWTLDAVKNYLYEIPGKNMLHYVPNAGHSMGDKKQVFRALNAFFSITLNNTQYPVSSWELTEKGKTIRLKIHAQPEKLIGAILWTTSLNSRDFRKSTWTKSELKLNSKNKSEIDIKQKYPKTGFNAFYVDLIYQDPNGEEFTVSTRTYTMDTKKVL